MLVSYVSGLKPAHMPLFTSMSPTQNVFLASSPGHPHLGRPLRVHQLIKKAKQRLYFLKTLKKAQLSSRILVNFCRCSIESILTQHHSKVCLTLPRIEDIHQKWCLQRVKGIIKDISNPNHGLFYSTTKWEAIHSRGLRSCTSRLLLFLCWTVTDSNKLNYLLTTTSLNITYCITAHVYIYGITSG